MQNSIIINVDKVLLSEKKRISNVLQYAFHWNSNTEELDTVDNLQNILTCIAKQQEVSEQEVEKQFWEIQQSCEYYDMESLKLPQAMKSAFEEMNKHAELIYFFAKPVSMKDRLKLLLQEYGLPLEDGKYQIACIPVPNPEVDTYEQKSFEGMMDYIRQTQLIKRVELVIGGSESDMAAAYSCCVPTVIYGKPNEETIIKRACKLMNLNADSFDIYGVACLNDWYDISIYAKSLLGDHCGLDDICNTHSTNYADWLSDLDQKSSLILVVGTFCAAIFVDILLERRSQGIDFVSVCSLIGFLTSVFSMLLAIRSFSSRVTHGSEAIEQVLNINLFHRKRGSFAYTPVVEKKKVSATQFGRSAKLRYLINRYGTLDYNSISSQNLFNLRAANYEKIYPEFVAKALLHCAIAMIVLIGAYSFVGSLNILPTGEDQLGNQSNINAYSIDSQIDDVLVKKSVYLFTYDDFSVDFSSLSAEGTKKVNQIFESLPETASTIYISFDESKRVLSPNKNVANSKREIILMLVHDAMSAKSRTIEVIFLCE